MCCVFLLLGFGTLEARALLVLSGTTLRGNVFTEGLETEANADGRHCNLRGSCQAVVPSHWPKRLRSKAREANMLCCAFFVGVSNVSCKI